MPIFENLMKFSAQYNFQILLRIHCKKALFSTKILWKISLKQL